MKEKSFTLVELLAVIFIIGILAGLLVPAIGKVRRDAQIKAQQAEIRTIEIALESFYSDYLQYPPDPNDINPDPGIDSHDATLDSFTVDNPDDPTQTDINIADTVTLNNASEVLYYYLCRKWEKTGGTVVCQIALDIDGDGNIDPKEYPGPAVDTDVDGAINEDNIDVPGGNGSPYLTPKKDRIGDSDGDGLLELLDMWGRPYLYWNNADGVTCETASTGNDPEDSAVCYQDVVRRPAGAVLDAGGAGGIPARPPLWHHPHNEHNFDIYSFGPNRADNLGFDDINFGDAKNDDDENTPLDPDKDDEDDVNNY